MALEQLLGGQTSHDIIPGRVDARKISAEEEKALEERKAAESGPVVKRKCAPVEYLRLFGRLPELSQVEALAPKDFNRDDVAELLKAGATYSQLAAYYGMSSAGHLGYYLKRAGLVGLSVNKPVGKKETEKPVEVLAPDEDAEKLDVSNTPVSEAARRAVEACEVKIANREIPTPPPTIDLDTWELITGEAKAGWPNNPVLRLKARGDCAIVFTSLAPGDKVVFRVSPTGRMLAVIKAENGRPLTLDKKTKRRLRLSCKKLADSLAEKGVILPADFRLEWNEAARAWIGTLIEKSEGVA